MPYTQYPIQNNQYPIPNTQHPIRNTHYPVPSTPHHLLPTPYSHPYTRATLLPNLQVSNSLEGLDRPVDGRDEVTDLASSA